MAGDRKADGKKTNEKWEKTEKSINREPFSYLDQPLGNYITFFSFLFC